MLIPSFRETGGDISAVSLKGIDNFSANQPCINDMMNLSCEAYPYIRTRYPRYTVADGTGYTSVSAVKELIWIKDGKLYYGGIIVGTLQGQYEDRKIFNLNDTVIVWPDKVYYDISADSFGSLETSVNVNLSGAEFKAGSGQNVGINSIHFSGVIWSLYGIREGDCIEIRHKVSGAVHDIGMFATVRKINVDTMVFDDNCFAGIENHVITSISRKVPDMDLIFECGNRLWGCSGHTIRCSAEGDPFNWYDAETCWSAEVGRGGRFTAGTGFDGSPIFIMEDMIWKIYGSKPVNFSPMPINSVRGVRYGCENSVAEAGGKLYYLSRDGVMCFGGGTPVKVSGKLGDVGLSDGIAVSDGRRYMLSAVCDGSRKLYVYDTDTGLWSCEDCLEISGAVYYEGIIFAVCDDGMITLGRTREPETSWQKETELDSYMMISDICPDVRNNRILTGIKMRAECAANSAFDLYIAYDNGEFSKADGVWSRLSANTESISGRGNYTVSIPVRTCDSFSLKIAGSGEYIIKNISLIYRKT